MFRRGNSIFISDLSQICEHVWLVALTKAHQHTNTPNTHTLSPYRCWLLCMAFLQSSLGSRTYLLGGTTNFGASFEGED